MIRRIRKEEVMIKTAWGKSKLNMEIANGNFPAPTYEGKIPYWLESDVDEFIIRFFGKEDSEAA